MVTLLFGRQTTKSIGGIEIDASLNEQIDFSNTVTDHPIEGGSSITDHVYENPLIVTMECVISNAALTSDDQGRAIDAYEQLKLLKSRREPFDVVNALDVYSNMIVQDLGIPRRSDTADSLAFTVVLKQIRIVDSVTVDLRPIVAPSVQNAASSKVNAGRATPTPASPTQAAQAQGITVRDAIARSPRFELL